MSTDCTDYTVPPGSFYEGQVWTWEAVHAAILDAYFDSTSNNTDLSPQQLLQLVSSASTQPGSDLMARDAIRDLGFTGLTEEFIEESARRIAESAAGSIEEIKGLL